MTDHANTRPDRAHPGVISERRISDVIKDLERWQVRAGARAIEIIKALDAERHAVLSLMPEAGWRDDVLRCEKCQSAATKLCQMTTHECDPMPICEDCAAEHDSIAAEINDHEMREFGAEYGMVTYHYLPLPPAPDPVKAAAGVLRREWDEHGEGLQGQLVTYSLADEGLVPDLDGAWVKLDDVTAALRALKDES